MTIISRNPSVAKLLRIFTAEVVIWTSSIKYEKHSSLIWDQHNYQHESSAMVYMAITKDAEANMEKIFEQTDTLNTLSSPSVQDQHPCLFICRVAFSHIWS